MKNIVLKTFISAFILSLLFLSDELLQGTAFDWSRFLLGFLSNVLIAIVLTLYITTTTIRGIKLAVAIFFIYYSIGFFNILIEAYIFNVTDRSITIRAMISGFVVILVYAPIIVLLFKKWKGESEIKTFEKRPLISWIWRIVLSDLSYVFFYLLAGFVLYLVYPPLMDFYEGKIPPFELMINTQFFRALIFMTVAFVILKTMNTTIIKKALFIGIFFTIVGGLAPLIPPNEHMPGYIRMGHAFEVAISNFSYGIVVSFLLAQKAMENKTEVKNALASR